MNDYELALSICASCLTNKCAYTYCPLYGYHSPRGKPAYRPDKALRQFCAQAVCKDACSRYCPISKFRNQKPETIANSKYHCRKCGSGLILNRNWSASYAKRGYRVCKTCDGLRKKAMQETPAHGLARE